MPAARIPRAVTVMKRDPREGMSASHLADVRKLPCVVTNTSPAEAHHLLRTGEHGMSIKSSDKWAIPLSTAMHDALHRDGDEDRFLARHGIDGRALAKSLWEARGDVERMKAVVFRVYQRAALRAVMP